MRLCPRCGNEISRMRKRGAIYCTRRCRDATSVDRFVAKKKFRYKAWLWFGERIVLAMKDRAARVLEEMR